MCLILIAWRVHADYPCVIAANRDEFHSRPTASARWWLGERGILAGRDLQAGGTWLGITRAGRFAALTNYRDPGVQVTAAASRGALVAGFLEQRMPLLLSLAQVAQRGANYNPFNLIASDGQGLGVYASTTGETRVLEPGVYALSNHLLDTPWPKVQLAKSRLATALAALPDTRALLELLRDDRAASDEQLPRTDVSIEHERMLSSAFVRGENYGTRSSTVVTIGSDCGVSFGEWSWNAAGALEGNVHFGFDLEPVG